MNYKKLLKDFHKTVYQKTKDKRGEVGQQFIAASPTSQLRVALIKEEAAELVEALLMGTEEEVRKELCDLLYVTFGTAATFSLPVDKDFLKVHVNNMLKVSTGTVREDGKLVKSPTHPKVNF